MVRARRGKDTVRSGDIRNFFPKAKAEESKPASTTGPAENKVSNKLTLSGSEPAESMTSSVRPSDKALGKRKRPQESIVADTKGPSEKALGKRKCSEVKPESDIEADDAIGDSNGQDHLEALVADALEMEFPDPSSLEYELLEAVFPDMLDDLEDPDLVAKQKSEVDDGLPGQPYHWKVFHRLIRDAGSYGVREDNSFPCKESLTRHSEEDLYQRLKASTMDIVWAQCVEKRTGLSEEFLSELPDNGSACRETGWYLIVLQGGSRHRVYVGQAKNIQGRSTRHRRNARDLGCSELLYHTWRAIPACEAKVYCLGLDKCGFADVDARLFRNIGEMFFALMFESLQRHHLDAWLSRSREVRGGHGLNVALPLSQATSAGCWIGKLLNSEDPELKAWARAQYADRWAKTSIKMKAFAKANPGVLEKSLVDYHAANPGKSQEIALAVHAKMRATGYKALSDAQRKNSSLTDCEGGVFRSADPAKGDLVIVRVKCVDCGHERDDTTPLYLIASGEYVTRQLSCISCAEKDPAGAKKKYHHLVPVDDDFPRIRRNTVHDRLKSPKWRPFYEGETATSPDAVDPNRAAAVAAVKGGLTRKAAAAKFNLPKWRVEEDCEGMKRAGTRTR